ncbi:MAG: hypothetical protein PWQ91_848 [Eubacteriales bacterium]|nr:hypothetical protein [Eubacteriales bacterium]
MTFYVFNGRRGLTWFLRGVMGLLLVLAAVAAMEEVTFTTALREPVYRGTEKRKEMALTVNVVWGEEYLPAMLEILRREKVAATFFIGGQWAEDNPKLLQKIAAYGHEIGSHGYSHPHPTALSPQENREELIKTEKIIKKITGRKVKLFAPPYGEYNQEVLDVAAELGYRTIMWTADTIDWQRPAPEVIVRRVLEKAGNGVIVLMHPTEPTVKALPEIIRELKKRGYKLVTVSRLLQ